MLEQRVVAAFMNEGHFARHLRRMRSLYAARRAALAAELGQAFGPRLTLTLQAGGMHLLARLADAPPDTELVRRRRGGGSGADCTVATLDDRAGGDGLLLGFTNVPEAAARALAQRLAAAMASRPSLTSRKNLNTEKREGHGGPRRYISVGTAHSPSDHCAKRQIPFFAALAVLRASSVLTASCWHPIVTSAVVVGRISGSDRPVPPGDRSVASLAPPLTPPSSSAGSSRSSSRRSAPRSAPRPCARLSDTHQNDSRAPPSGPCGSG